MADDLVGEINSQNERFLTDGFDIRPKYLQISFESRSDESALNYDPAKLHRNSESIVNLPESGIVFLLGKNGAGKSRFLKGLEAYANGKTETFPSIGLICETPSLESQLNFYDELDHLAQFMKMEGKSNHKREYCRVDFTDILLDSFQACDEPSIPFPLIELRKSQLLEVFGASNADIKLWKERQSTFINQNDDSCLGTFDEQNKRRNSYDFGEHFLDFFLACLSRSHFHQTGNINDQFYLSGLEWWSDEDKRSVVFDALKEMITTATYIRIRIENGTKMFELLVRKPEHGPIFDLLEKRHGPDRNSPWHHLNRPDGFIDSYPFDLLQELDLFGETFIQSIPIPIAETFRTNPNYVSDCWKLVDLSILDSSGDRESVIEQLQAQIFLRFCSPRTQYHNLGSEIEFDKTGNLIVQDTDERTFGVDNGSDAIYVYGWLNSHGYSQIESDDLLISIQGYEQVNLFFERVSSLISNCDIGIAALRAAHSPRRSSLFSGHFDLAPMIEFQDLLSDKWMPISQSSQGQFDVILLLCKMHLMTTKNTSLRMLLADEFDKHLHPTAATKVLEVVQHFASNNRMVAFFSTHSLSQYISPAIRFQPRIFFGRSATGEIQLTDESSADPKIVAEVLGTSEMDAYLLKHLYIMVEGVHEMEIFNDLLKADVKTSEAIRMFSSAGTFGFTGIWETLRLLNAPILIIYDKKSVELETAWTQIQLASLDSKNRLSLWNDYGIKKLFNQVKRRSKEKIHGDTELRSLLYLLKLVLESDDCRQNALRIFLHGVAYPDIVDALPVHDFGKGKKYKSWSDARSELGNPLPTDFKYQMGIYEESVQDSLKRIKNHKDPELLKIREKIHSLLASTV